MDIKTRVPRIFALLWHAAVCAPSDLALPPAPGIPALGGERTGHWRSTTLWSDLGRLRGRAVIAHVAPKPLVF